MDVFVDLKDGTRLSAAPLLPVFPSTPTGVQIMATTPKATSAPLLRCGSGAGGVCGEQTSHDNPKNKVFCGRGRKRLDFTITTLGYGFGALVPLAMRTQ